MAVVEVVDEVGEYPRRRSTGSAVNHGCWAAPVRGAAQVAASSYELGTSMNASAAEASSPLQRHQPVWAVTATYR